MSEPFVAQAPRSLNLGGIADRAVSRIFTAPLSFLGLIVLIFVAYAAPIWLPLSGELYRSGAPAIQGICIDLYSLLVVALFAISVWQAGRRRKVGLTGLVRTFVKRLPRIIPVAVVLALVLFGVKQISLALVKSATVTAPRPDSFPLMFITLVIPMALVAELALLTSVAIIGNISTDRLSIIESIRSSVADCYESGRWKLMLLLAIGFMIGQTIARLPNEWIFFFLHGSPLVPRVIGALTSTAVFAFTALIGTEYGLAATGMIANFGRGGATDRG
jgi:hypothetical protein